eukprot:430730-Prorocentrum_minimum.AAC.1
MGPFLSAIRIGSSLSSHTCGRGRRGGVRGGTLGGIRGDWKGICNCMCMRCPLVRICPRNSVNTVGFNGIKRDFPGAFAMFLGILGIWYLVYACTHRIVQLDTDMPAPVLKPGKHRILQW